MDTSVHKQAISNVTGLQVGERNGAWVVKDVSGWRDLIAGEIDLATAEYDRLIKESAVPASITMRQARLVLNTVGLLSTVESSIASMPKEVQIEWEYASEVQRNSPTITTLQDALGLSDAEVDQMFVDGAKL